MCRELRRNRNSLVVVRSALAVLALVAGPAFAGPTELTSCGQTVTGKAFLSADLDCSGTSLHGVELNDHGKLELNGHTLTADSQRLAVHCLSSCAVHGPGTLTTGGTDAGGVHARKNLKIKNVTLTGFGVAVSTQDRFGKGRVLVDDSTISNVGWGVRANVPVRLSDTTVTGATGSGIVTGENVESGLPCTGVATTLKRSSVTGSGTDPLCGVDTSGMGYLGHNCADIITCEKPPRLQDSSCGASCQGGTGLPCTSWGICTGD
jgi:hypothetical protein